jgi:hypothetical protein
LYKARTLKAADQIEDIHGSTSQILRYAKHLEKLDALTDIKDNLLSFAVGKDQIPTKVVEAMMVRADKNSRLIYTVLGLVIVALIGVLAFLLTGEHLGWVHKLFQQG